MDRTCVSTGRLFKVRRTLRFSISFIHSLCDLFANADLAPAASSYTSAHDVVDIDIVQPTPIPKKRVTFAPEASLQI